MFYQVQYGDSPASIARKFGVSFTTLVAANPQKPTNVVNGARTWTSLRVDEDIAVPEGNLGSADSQSAAKQFAKAMAAMRANQAQLAASIGTAGNAFGDDMQDRMRRALAIKQAMGLLDLGALTDVALAAKGWRRLEGGTFLNHLGVHTDRWGRPIGYGPMHPLVPSHLVVARSGIHGVHGLGDAASDAVNALISAGSPCDQANVDLVCAAQSAMGLGVDGKWGNDTANAAASLVSGAPAGCSPRPAWWAPSGQVNCSSSTLPSPTAPSSSAALDAAAAAALAALSMDANYCTSVGQNGTAVNTAVHNFKSAWNAANPGNTVPIGTGKYEPSVAAALSSALGGQAPPAGCGAAGATPQAPLASFIPALNAAVPGLAPALTALAPGLAPALTALAPTPMQTLPSPSPLHVAAAAALAALSMDANYCTSVGQNGTVVNTTVHNFKSAWNAANPGNTVPIGTGKYEPSVAAALSSALGGQAPPAGCGAAAPAAPLQSPVAAFTPAAYVPPAPPPPSPPISMPTAGYANQPPLSPSTSGGTGTIVAPAKAGMSTGIMVAGAVGAVALVGLIVIGSKSEKVRSPISTHRKAAHTAHRKAKRR